MKKKFFVYLLSGILSLASIGNFAADASNDFPSANQTEQGAGDNHRIDTNAVEGTMEMGLAALIILLSNFLAGKEKLNFIKKELTIKVPFKLDISQSHESDISKVFMGHAEDFIKMIMNELDDPIRPTVSIEKLDINIKNKKLCINARVRMAEIKNNKLAKEAYESTISKIIEYLALEKLSDIQERMLQPLYQTGSGIEEVIHMAFKEEIEMVIKGIKLLKPRKK